MIRPEIKHLIEKAIYDEQHHIVTEKPMFHSNHEAWAVLEEEIEEAELECLAIENWIEDVWIAVKNDEDPHEEISELIKHAKLLASEAIQVAAVGEKFFLRKGEKNE